MHIICTAPQEVDPTYSPVSLLPSKMAPYAFPVLTTLETYTPSAYSSVQELDLDSSVKCSAIQQVHYSNCYSLELLGTADETIRDRSEPHDDQSASLLEDKHTCHGVKSVIHKENTLSASTDQFEAKSVQSNTTTEDRHDTATHQQITEHNVLLTSSAPVVHCPSGGYVAADGDMLHRVPSSAQDQWKMTNTPSENYPSTPYPISTSELLPNPGHNDSNRNSQSLGCEAQPTARHSPLPEPLCDSGIPVSMLGSHFRLPLPSYSATDSSPSLSDHVSSGYSSSDYMVASSLTSSGDTFELFYPTNVSTSGFPDNVCHFMEMDEATAIDPAESSEDDSGIHSSLNSGDSNANNSIHKTALSHTASTVKVCPKTGIPAPSSFTSHHVHHPVQHCNGLTPNEVREQEILPG